MSKLIIFSAPSGTGKSTLIRHLIKKDLNMKFSISATSRAPRGEEQHGVEYFFLSPEEFREKITQNKFIEYEEVYPNRFYGTLKSEVDKILEQGDNVVLDIDFVGALNVKKVYGDRALAIFIMPPSIDTLRQRLEKRGTDKPEVIENRLAKAEYEMSYAPKFDRIIENDDFEKARQETYDIIKEFINA